MRTTSDLSSDKINGKVRSAINERIPYMVVVGERDAAAGTVSVRTRAKDQGATPLAAFIEMALKEITEKALSAVAEAK